jgi:hypothetical protein
MNINIPDFARDHFWEEPPAGHEEFWSFRFPPPCKAGDPLAFKFDGVIVATATVSRVEQPGLTKCAGTGRFGGGFKVYWSPESFRDVRRKQPATGLFSEASR